MLNDKLLISFGIQHCLPNWDQIYYYYFWWCAPSALCDYCLIGLFPFSVQGTNVSGNLSTRGAKSERHYNVITSYPADPEVPEV